MLSLSDLETAIGASVVQWLLQVVSQWLPQAVLQALRALRRCLQRSLRSGTTRLVPASNIFALFI